MSTAYWVLGAGDPEMEMIERLLRESMQHVVYALHGGERVRPESAYRADGLSESIPEGARVYRVECDGPAIPAGAQVIDHHHPGDPGYGRPPAEFMAASSLGQVLAAMARIRALTETGARSSGWTQVRRAPFPELTSGWFDGALALGGDLEHPCGDNGDYISRAWVGWFTPPPEILLCAAADHCLAAAYRGECPGVGPDALMRWRMETRARFLRRPVEQLLADVEHSRVTLREVWWGVPCQECFGEGCRSAYGERMVCYPEARAHRVTLLRRSDGSYLEAADMRGIPKLYELPEASAREGICFIADGLPGRDGRVKIVCQSGTDEQIRAFMEVWAPSQGLVDIYGDPARGIAGGYMLGREFRRMTDEVAS